MKTQEQLLEQLGKLMGAHTNVYSSADNLVYEQKDALKKEIEDQQRSSSSDSSISEPDSSRERTPKTETTGTEAAQVADQTLFRILPDSVVNGFNSLFERPSRNPASMGDLSRSDLAHSMWADIHRITRSAAKQLIDPLVEAAEKSDQSEPHNQELAAIATIATNAFNAFKTQYAAAQTIESRFKSDFRQANPGKSSAGKEAGVEWKKVASDKLNADQPLQDARKATEDALVSPPGLSIFEEGYDEKLSAALIDKYATLLADYKDEFPLLEEDKLLDAIRMGEKIATYSFISQYGLLDLSDRDLTERLKEGAELASPGAREIAQITDKLNSDPFNVGIVGMDESTFPSVLAGHARQMQVYSIVERLCLGTDSLDKALPVLDEFGIKEEMQIKTGREMGAVIGAIGYVLKDEELISLSNEFSSAKTKTELQTILDSPAYTQAVEQISEINIASVEETKQEAMQKAASLVDNVNDLDIKAKSAVRQVTERSASSAHIR